MKVFYTVIIIYDKLPYLTSKQVHVDVDALS